MSLFDLQKPDATTVIRWVLRVVLVVFLAWLVRRRPEQDEEEEEEEAYDARRPAAKPRGAGVRSAPRIQQPRREHPYPQPGQVGGVRQRRPLSGADGGMDFDAVIDKMSKPKEMWEVRKEGSAPQILPRADVEPLRPTKIPPAPRPGREGDAKAGAAASATEKQLRGHERPVTMITWNRDGNLIFTCGKDKIVCVWSFPEGEQLGTYTGHQGAVWACSVTADSRWLVTSGADRLVIVWEARTSRELARVELPGVVRFVEWAGGAGGAANPPVSERFATCHNRFGGHPPAVTVWRFNGNDPSVQTNGKAIEELLQITTLPTAACQVKWGRGDYLVASAHDNGELVFWRSDTGAEVKRLKAHDQGISRFEFNHDRELVATVSHDASVKIWDVGKGSDWGLLYTSQTDRALNAVAFGPLAHAAAVGDAAKRPDKVCIICAGGQDARDVALSGTATEQFGTLLFKLGKEPTPCALEADGVTKGHFGPVHTLAFARDGSAIASGSEDGCVRTLLFVEAAQPAP
mmetsp:Transcript_72179/g.188266  ORF Transcript_72179/g.188266 Transcript_72179/m.188266 type:complete len:518 (-) Transcript_72179:45-1598(-)